MNSFESAEKPKIYLRFVGLKDSPRAFGLKLAVFENSQTETGFILSGDQISLNPNAFFDPPMNFIFPNVKSDSDFSDPSIGSAKLIKSEDGKWEIEAYTATERNPRR